MAARLSDRIVVSASFENTVERNQPLTVWYERCKCTRDHKKEVVMKCQVTRILSIGIALVTVAAVQAQDKTVTANVPFNFYIGSKAMSQGAYTVAEFWHGAVVALRSADGATSVTTHEVTSNQRFEPA